ncbi:TetR/AcrR family transcriptional regulator [Actinokineospora sp. 24-640]
MAESGTRMSAERRYEQIVAAAMSAFSRTGYSGTTTEHIAALVGVSQPYVIRLVGTKHALFLAAFDRACDAMEHYIRSAVSALERASSEERLDALRAAGYRDILADRDLMGMMLHAFAAAGTDDKIREVVRVRYGAIFVLVAEATGAPPEGVRDFMAVGILWQILAVLGAAGPDATHEWALPIPW